MTEAFVYCWTDHQTNKLYIGSHKGTIDDGYICSSEYMIEEYSKRPTDFTRQIIATGSAADIRVLETKLLKTLNAAKDPTFYNRHNGFGTYLTEEIKTKIGHKSKERWKSLTDEKKQEWIETIRVANQRPKTELEKQSMRGKRPHVNQSGANNNNARKITTPYGIFGSIVDCAEATGMAYDNIYYRLRRTNHKDWDYI